MSFLSNIKNINSLLSNKEDFKDITFYAESKNDWAHFKSLILEILNNSNYKISYITSDKNDLAHKIINKKFKVYLIDNIYLLSWIFKNIKTKLFFMTLPDLEKFYFKRSKFKVNYVYIQHSLVSLHMIYRKGAFDSFDTIFCSGEHHIKEIQAMENKYNLKKKKLIKYGYGKIDDLILENKFNNFSEIKKQKNIHFLIAPSWGKNCIIENGTIFNIIDNIILQGHRVTLRPHPETIKKSIPIIDKILTRYSNNKLFSFDKNLDNNNIYFQSDIMISDWSGAAYEYAFALNKPVLFVDSPRKINNPDYEELKLTPFEVYMREIIGSFYKKKSNYLLGEFKKIDANVVNKNLFYIENSAKIGLKYINDFLRKK